MTIVSLSTPLVTVLTPESHTHAATFTRHFREECFDVFEAAKQPAVSDGSGVRKTEMQLFLDGERNLFRPLVFDDDPILFHDGVEARGELAVVDIQTVVAASEDINFGAARFHRRGDEAE